MSYTVQHTEDLNKPQRLYLSREFFADYLTALLTRIRQDEKCNGIYTGKQKHPLVAVQRLNQRQLQTLHINFIPEATLTFTPFRPADNFIVEVNTKSNATPKLDNGWDAFITSYAEYKDSQHKIYAIIVATLRVGQSMHYARAVPYATTI